MRHHELTRRDALRLLALGGVGSGLSGCGRGGGPPAPAAPPLSAAVGECVLDPARLAPLRPCMESCGPESPADEWDHACIHPRTGAYSCGRLAHPGGPNEHDHDPDELARCRQLAAEAGALCRGLQVNLSEGSSDLAPFFVTANRHEPAPDRLTPEVVRAAFGGTIYPAADIVVEPLAEGNRGWQAIADSDDGELRPAPGAEAQMTEEQLEALRRDHRARWAKRVGHWRAVLKWFGAQGEFVGTGFVLVGQGDPLSPTNFGCVFPRLVAGLTKAGSLAGVCGHAVHT